ncbi:MAG TPA: tetratricopeptide repeat protein [Cyclobacteriaceae bacterium]
MNRVEQLEEFLREDPNDPFNSYALALEYLKTDEKKASGLFEILLSKHPNYLPTYYPFAQLLSEKQDKRAEDIYKQGIESARRLGDHKTLKELSSAYNDWLFEQS